MIKMCTQSLQFVEITARTPHLIATGSSRQVRRVSNWISSQLPESSTFLITLPHNACSAVSTRSSSISASVTISILSTIRNQDLLLLGSSIKQRSTKLTHFLCLFHCRWDLMQQTPVILNAWHSHNIELRRAKSCCKKIEYIYIYIYI